MTEKVEKCKDFLLNRGYRKNRNFRKADVTAETRDLSEEERIFIRFERAANDEKPIFTNRTISDSTATIRFFPKSKRAKCSETLPWITKRSFPAV